MKTENNPPEEEKSSKSKRGILCPKCEHLNPLGLDKCEYCQGHLFIVCKKCGATNQRVLSRCTSCRQAFHGGDTPRWLKKLKGRQAFGITWRQALVIIVVAVGTYYVITKLAGSAGGGGGE